jgi:hypothetical protein
MATKVSSFAVRTLSIVRVCVRACARAERAAEDEMAMHQWLNALRRHIIHKAELAGKNPSSPEGITRVSSTVKLLQWRADIEFGKGVRTIELIPLGSEVSIRTDTLHSMALTHALFANKQVRHARLHVRADEEDPLDRFERRQRVQFCWQSRIESMGRLSQSVQYAHTHTSACLTFARQLRARWRQYRIAADAEQDQVLGCINKQLDQALRVERQDEGSVPRIVCCARGRCVVQCRCRKEETRFHCCEQSRCCAMVRAISEEEGFAFNFCAGD